MPSTAATIHPVTSLAADIVSGQCASTNQNAIKYCVASKARLQRQSRLINKPMEVTASRMAASQSKKFSINVLAKTQTARQAAGASRADRHRLQAGPRYMPAAGRPTDITTGSSVGRF